MKQCLWRMLLGVLLIAAVTTCSDDELTDNEYVNDWISKVMKRDYLWTQEMPSPSKSTAPGLYFKALLSKKDRFSWIQENYEELQNSLSGINKEAGYDFKLYGNANNNNVDMQVTYIKAGSPVDVDDVDLQRGDLISSIGGQRLTRSNYRDILSLLSESHSITYARFNPETETWEDKGTVMLRTAQFAENPNFLSKVIPVSDRKIGYYVYNFFAAGTTSSSTQYDDEMAAVFDGFKASGITDLVLDLRFNGGGSILSSSKLASYTGNNVQGKVFTKFEYNARYQPDELPFADGAAHNIGTLRNNRVYVLTSRGTASASELVINGLKPYMDVFVVGDTTYGKNVASSVYYAQNDPRNKWGILPIIAKLSNSVNFSDYDAGFVPNILDQDNRLVVYPLGDPNEALLSRVIDHITGGPTARREDNHTPQGILMGLPGDFRKRGYTVILDDEQSKRRFTHTPGSF